MTTNDDKKRWKDEANQLKKDLARRKKVIQKREVPITFPKKGPKITPTESTPSAGSARSDDFFKHQINIQPKPPTTDQ